MYRYLVPPARFSNGVLLVLAVTVALAVSWAAGQLAATLIGLASAAYLFAALRLFAYRKALYTVIGSLMTVVAASGVLATPVLAASFAASRFGSVRVALGTLVPLLLVGGLVALGQEYLPETGTKEFKRAGEAVVLTAVVFGAVTGAWLLLGLALPALEPAAVLGDTTGAVADAVTGTHVAQLAGLVVLLAAAIYLLVRVGRLPLLTRGLRWIATELADDAAAEATSDHPAVGAGRALADRADLVRRTAIALGSVGAFLLVAGAIDPSLSRPLDDVARRFPASLVFADAAPLHVALTWASLALVGVALAHRVAWWLIHIDWERYRDRATRLGGPLVLVGVVIAASGPMVEVLVSNPALHYVLSPDAGFVVAMTDEGLGFEAFRPRLGRIAFERSTEAFVPGVRWLADALGPPVVTLIPLSLVFIGLTAAMLGLWVAISIGWVLLFGAWELESDARIGIGLLFVGTVVSATLRVPPRIPLVAVALTLLAWDLHRLSTGVRLQLDPAARTLRGELVHLGTNAVVLVGVVGLTLGGQRLMGLVPRPTAPWQGLAVLVFALAAALSSLLALSLSGD